VLRDGAWEAGGVRIPGSVAPHLADGDPVAAVFAPGAVRLARSGPADADAGPVAPAASATWTARVRRLEPTLAGVRVHTVDPPVAVDVPLDAMAAAGLETGTEVVLRLDAADVRILPDRVSAMSS
jgi:molybdate transport system ATP-binding protein